MILSVYIESNKLDLYKDESIVLSSSVLDVQDIKKNTTDFTNSFTVPASANNNKIFKHYYNANIENTFDARVSVFGRIDLGGLPFRVGKIILNSVSVKNGSASSYKINFTGNLIKLTELFNDDKLKDLDLSAYDHTYDFETVKSGLRATANNINYIYSMIAKRRFIYNSSPPNQTNTEDTVNIAYNSSTQANGIQWDELQPSLKLERILEATEAKYNITFSRDFFGTDNFKNLYLWLNNTESKETAQATAIIDFNAGSNAFMNLTTNIGTYNTQGDFYKYWTLYINITPLEGYGNINYSILMYDGDDIINQVDNVVGYGRVGQRIRDNENTGNRDYHIRYEIRAEDTFKYSAVLEQYLYVNSYQYPAHLTQGNNLEISRNVVVSQFVPDLKIVDFWKGIFQAFKLVIIPISENEFYVNDVNSYYAEGNLLDVTKYVDTKLIPVERGKILSDIKLNFEEPKTILNAQFKENTGKAYGDEEVIIRDENGQVLDGEDFELKLPFEQILYEKLTDGNNNNFTNIVYAGAFDKNLKSVNPKAHIHYNRRESLSGASIAIRDTDGTVENIGSMVNMPSHSNGNTEGNAFLFSREISVYDGGLMVNNLYSTYHKRYIERLFNKRRRDFEVKLKNTPLHILTKLSLNDLIQIKNDYYVIQKFQTNLITQEVKLKLQNVFESDVSIISTNQKYVYIQEGSSSKDIYISNLQSQSFITQKQDVGYGVDWITITSSGNTLTITASYNYTLENRLMSLVVTNRRNTSNNFSIAIEQLPDPAP